MTRSAVLLCALAATALMGQAPSREYIRLNGRVIAIENSSAAPGGEPPWYSGGGTWTKRRKLIIDRTKVSGATPLQNFPALFSATEAEFMSGGGGSVGRVDGRDILFTADNGVSKLDHELDKYVSGTGQVLAWVRVPSLSTTVDTVLYMYYGNAAAADQQNASGVWAARYQSVYHFRDDASFPTDSAGTNQFSNGGAVSAAGQIDRSALFDTGSATMRAPLPSGVSAASAWTVSLWAKLNDSPSLTNIFNLSSASANLGICYWWSAAGVLCQRGSGNDALRATQLAAGVDRSVWHLWTFTWDGVGDAMKVYVDGIDKTAATGDHLGPEIASGFDLSRGLGGGYPSRMTADEVRVQALYTSTDWARTEYANQASPGTFMYSASGTGSTTSVATNPAGLPITVDGQPCPNPCNPVWAPGSQHNIATAAQVAGVTGVRYVFTSWSDGGAASHTVTAGATPWSYTANYKTQYFLTVQAIPSAGGTLTAAPASADGWYDANTAVTLTAAPTSGYVFSSLNVPATFSMNGAVSATASFTPASTGWYGVGGTWAKRRRIAIDRARVAGPDALINFPMLFSKTDPDFKKGNGGSVLWDDGRDILFTASDGVTKLPHEMEKYVPGTGEVTAWVSIPALSSGADTTLYVYYGGSAAASQENRTGVWGSGYKSVFHYRDGTTLAASDATGNANHGTASAAVAAAGKFDGAAQLDGAGAMVRAPLPPGLSAVSPWTVSMWAKLNAAPGLTNLFNLNDGSTNLGICYWWSSGNGMLCQRGDLDNTQSSELSGAVALDQWHLWTFTSDGGATRIRVYVDGSERTATSGGILSAENARGFDLSRGLGGGYPSAMTVDEARVLNLALPAGWIATEFNNQGSDVPFYTVEAPSGGAAPEFALSPPGSPAGLAAGGSNGYAIAVSALNGFSGVVNLSATDSGSGLTFSFAPQSVAGAGTSTLTITAGAGAAGTHTITVTGTAAALIRTAAFSVSVTSPQPYVNISPGSTSVSAPGGSGQIAVSSNTNWTVQDITPGTKWITIVSPQPDAGGIGRGNGNGTIQYSAGANTTAGTRTGSLQVGSWVFTLTQAKVSQITDFTPTYARVYLGEVKQFDAYLDNSAAPGNGQVSWSAVDGNGNSYSIVNGLLTLPASIPGGGVSQLIRVEARYPSGCTGNCISVRAADVDFAFFSGPTEGIFLQAGTGSGKAAHFFFQSVVLLGSYTSFDFLYSPSAGPDPAAPNQCSLHVHGYAPNAHFVTLANDSGLGSLPNAGTLRICAGLGPTSCNGGYTHVMANSSCGLDFSGSWEAQVPSSATQRTQYWDLLMTFLSPLYGTQQRIWLRPSPGGAWVQVGDWTVPR